MARYIVLILLAFVSFSVQGQIIIDKPVVLDGPTQQQRQVTGLSPSTVGDSPATADVEQSGLHRTAIADASSNWQLDLPGLTGAPGAGTHIVVLVPATQVSGAVQLMVNGSGPYPVLLAPGSPLMGVSDPSGSPLSLVFDGSAFHVMNGHARVLRDCPSGMVTVNAQYCMDVNETDTTAFFVASKQCITQNKRLCTWGEWYGACIQAASLGLLNMTGNWEWTNSTANEDYGVRFVGPNCTSSGTWSVLNAPQRYRCCYSR